MARPTKKLPTKKANVLGIKKHTTFKRKKFVFHGRVVTLQGHENYGLRDLMQRCHIDFKDIVYKPTEMPKILYTHDCKIHRYIPDFWVPIRNLIIEIKSKYTFEKNHSINILKAIACIEAGYDFETWIYNRKGTLEHVLNKTVFV